MATVRRWYLFVVSLISLQSVTWAIIALLRDLIVSSQAVPLDAMTFKIAVILVGLPIFLVHWLWMQRLARRDEVERLSPVRGLYFYSTLALFLLPFVNNAYHLVATWLRLLFGETISSFGFSPTEMWLRNVVAMVVLALFWFYHQRLVVKESAGTNVHATIRRFYVLGLTAVGLGMTTTGSINLLEWLMFLPTTTLQLEVASILALLIVGLPLWLLFWSWAQRIFESEADTERDSALRKFYLYAVIFIVAFAAVSNATLILQGILSRLLALSPEGDIRDPLSIIIVMSVLWAYHTSVLRHDGLMVAQAQATSPLWVRRLYFYLVATIGLAAFLIGLAGCLSVLIRSLEQQALVIGLKDELTWFTSALIVGLPVWLLPWRQVQLVAVAEGVEGKQERRSIVRKLYLYFYIFVATMTVLIGAVYIVQQLLNLLFGERHFAGLLSDVGQAIAFVLIAIGVWFYHGFVLRTDGQHSEQEEKERLSAWRVVVVDREEGDFGQPLLTHLRQELPGLSLKYISLTPGAPGSEGAPGRGGEEVSSLVAPSPQGGLQQKDDQITTQLTEADLIIAPWTIVAPNLGLVTPAVSQAIASSAAHKLLIPTRGQKWEWVGTMSDSSKVIEQTIEAVKQIVAGQEVKAKQAPNAAMIVLSIMAGLFVLWLLLILLSAIASLSF